MTDPTELRKQAGRLGVELDQVQTRKLLRYEELLIERALPMGMIAEGDAPKIRPRHVLDSLRAAPAMEEAAEAYDLGSGAGLPGVAIAIACPHVRMGLVDSRRRRIAFLELAIEELDLPNATVLGQRAESLTSLVDVCVARAFAPLPRAWGIADRVLRPAGRLVFFAGARRRAVPPAGGDPTVRAEGLTADQIPADARVLDVLEPTLLESSGPLVIMTRQ